MSNNNSAPRTQFQSITNMKCPRCREGDLFYTSTFAFKRPFDMPERCPKCNLNYTPEPGFFYGAMFISYAIWGWFSIFFCLLTVFYFGWTVNSSFAVLIFFSAIFFIWLFRISRSLWIHFNIKYDSSKA
ncbi:MAG: DUF983 domain-containing protein [Saprospiraceae bacterium]